MPLSVVARVELHSARVELHGETLIHTPVGSEQWVALKVISGHVDVRPETMGQQFYLVATDTVVPSGTLAQQHAALDEHTRLSEEMGDYFGEEE
jgi:hypothetical protein